MVSIPPLVGVDILRERIKTLPFFYRGANMACECIPNIPRYTATSVAVTAGVATITIPATPTINAGDVIDVLLSTSIPDGTDGAQLVITNETITTDIMNGNGNYLRFYPLTSRTILRVQYLNDPAHFQILNVFGRKIKRYA